MHMWIQESGNASLCEAFSNFAAKVQVHLWAAFFIISINCLNVPVAQWLEHCVSIAKVVGSIPREHGYWQKQNNV